MAPKSSDINFPVVGVGASAGGLDAFKKLVRNIPANSGMAYVLVQHLAPDHDSLLSEILSRETTVPVLEIIDDINIHPNHIYVIPENKMLTVYDGKLKLGPRESIKPNMAIDVFFNSLAEVHKGFARGVLLSGTGFDGTRGLQTIKEGGGSTFVQNPESAAYDIMPLSAIRASAADFILEAEEIPEKLQHVDNAYESSNAYEDDDDAIAKIDDDFYKHIIRLLKLKTGNDFAHYKQPTIRRRIARRMVITKKEEPETYLAYLKSNKDEQDALFNDVLIPVSYFFRDSKIFSMLCETAFPRILKEKKPNGSIRVWIAGCSTGQEAYSIAISLHEFLADKMPEIKVQIFASDISENVIARARAGVYSKQEVQNISETRLKNYFTKIENAYHINKDIRDMCIFAVHNFVKDPPFAKMDIISCRNVLIYLDPFLQKKTLDTFHYSLMPNGILFLGKSETAGNVINLFEPLVKNQKIYARKDSTDNYKPAAYERMNASPAYKQAETRKKPFEPDFHKQANELLFTKYTPAGVIINQNKEIIHFHGDTSPFLVQPPGKPNFNIFKMLRDGLAFELRTALLKVKANHESITKENLELKGLDYLVNLEIIPLENKNEEGHLLVLFHKVLRPSEDKPSVKQRKSAQTERIRQLEAEIEQMREDIRRVTEDQEVANEELQSANEELLSNSEELQTLNEELETSAEELQSNNEELISVNDELMDRQEQLTMARMYAEAIIQTIREPLVILNKELRIKSANASFYNHFKTTEQDTEGKLIFDLAKGHWQISELKNELLKALNDKAVTEGLEIKIQFPDLGERTMLLNIRPILNDSLGEQLILLAIEDITDIRAANNMLLYNNRELLESNKELLAFSYIASHDLQEPLRKIHTFTKMISNDPKTSLSGESATFLDRIMVSVRRMQLLTDDLLNYAQISNSNDDEVENTDLNSLVNDVLEDLKDTVQSVNAEIKVSELPVVKVIPLLMRQLFINLIGNAIKYRKADGQPIVNISFSVADKSEIADLGVDPETRYYRIKIADNGIGFPQEQSQRIFEAFQRLHGKDKYEGTGIGLAICKKIALRHDGFITAESNPGSGATFNLFLPL
ncbi:ATP-binding protein [Flavobacterium sp. J372]|uniref:CheR family methyltransferase n=1 Tax=Flavobacterium sp. J372 TaxID=2898436 RepID=UPI002150A0C9|nr:CheR family methyltransferase [Flavobacterium sp. J372]MCR5862059.1 ATP-binding protein [Flavobacterium sp. J372]